ncbi:hypothetical protein MTR_2g094710 [Medicago truncatula]|uniref:Uncharacterized protein n=1 Tax=Medicago truncatula TaxID=3880 RepID=A0A072VC40_MEDTR|nr:hypothetical protein MTR_2g094710 [Medicago truncatula]
MTNFSKTKRPPKDKCFDFQPDSLELMRLIRGSQKTNRPAFPPIGNPRYIKEMVPTLQFKTVAASDNHEPRTLIPTRRLLEKFTNIQTGCAFSPSHIRISLRNK